MSQPSSHLQHSKPAARHYASSHHRGNTVIYITLKKNVVFKYFIKSNLVAGRLEDLKQWNYLYEKLVEMKNETELVGGPIVLCGVSAMRSRTRLKLLITRHKRSTCCLLNVKKSCIFLATWRYRPGKGYKDGQVGRGNWSHGTLPAPFPF